MPVFISYSHHDKAFVSRLATHLMKHRTWVWVDTWEINVGDSIIEKIQKAIQEASALVVVLSSASVESVWCKKELTAGLVRELEEKRIVVLPALLEECAIPLFLRDKKYADFRTNFDTGLRETLEAIAQVTSETQWRTESAATVTDWGINWFRHGRKVIVRITIVEHGAPFPYCTITEVQIRPNEAACSRYIQYERIGLDWFARLIILECLAEFLATNAGNTHALLEDSSPVTVNIAMRDSKLGVQYDVRVSCRRLGTDVGKDTFLHWGQQILQARDTLRRNTRKLTAEESARLEDLLIKHP